MSDKKWKIEVCTDEQNDVWAGTNFVYSDFHHAVRGAMTLMEHGNIARVREVKEDANEER